ncbi:uncharacterized protein isoform X3 [Musca autumnalis]|uniref:uncharacterized protein isoform X3 n=1 Tax=Musca autumnalis TaxID=221902 RepID=UPI003CE8447C
MSEKVSIKTEPFGNDYKKEDSKIDTNTINYSTIKLEDVTNMGNYYEEDELDLDEIEEFLPENTVKSTIDVIKEEDVDKMDEFLPEASPSIYSPSSLTWKSEDCTDVITTSLHTLQQQQHPNSTITQPKLEIMDLPTTDEDDSKGLEINDDTDTNVSENKEMGMRYKHLLSVNNEYVCHICNQRFTTPTGIDVHLRRTHPEAYSIKIPTKYNRKKHTYSEYICEKCQKRFTTQIGLKKHSGRMHPEAHSTQTRTKKHKCELCDCSYTEERSLRRHMRKSHHSFIGTDYICEICHERFYTQGGLNAHSHLIHPENQTGTRYQCELCDSSYSEDRSLRSHISKKHQSSINTEHICEICHRRFTTKSGLERHTFMMHPEAPSTYLVVLKYFVVKFVFLN